MQVSSWVGFICCYWILVGSSYCPILVKANPDDSKISVIRVCSESALAAASQRQQHDNIKGKGEGWAHWQAPGHWVSSNQTTKFSLLVGEPKCMFPIHQILKRENDPEVDYNASMVHFYPNGYFRIDRDIYAPDEYCIESFFQQSTLELPSLKIKLCTADCGPGKRRPCIKKCCPLDKIFAFVNRPSCQTPPSGSVEFLPTFYDDYYTKSHIYDNNSPFTSSFILNGSVAKSRILMPHYIINYPKIFKENCKDKIVLPLPASEQAAHVLSVKTKRTMKSSMFHVRTDGAIMYKILEHKCASMSMNLDTYCIDGISGVSNLTESSSPFMNTEDEYIIFQCQVIEKDPNLDKYLSFTFGVLLITTSVFPFITSLVYVLLYKKQNIHGWTIAATSGSLFLMYVFQGSAHLIGVTLKEKALNTPYCILLGLLVHYFMLATFTWCSVLTFDLFITFRSVVPMNQRLQGVSRFLKYSAFGWGVPTVAVLIGILMDFVIYTSNDCSYHAVPGYGLRSCWIVEDSLGPYLYYPGFCLLCVNILLFSATCAKLCMYGRGTTVRARKNNEAFGECFSRFSKLFCVMGISWITEIICWYFFGLGFVGPVWIIFDLFNILRAVAMFAIYVCKSDIVKQLEDSYPTLKRIYRPCGRLFLRKCSDEISTESTVLSAIPNSPAVGMKATVNNSCGSRGSTRQKKEKDADACEL